MTTQALDTATTRDHGWTIIVTYRARTAVRQLTDAEQEAVRQALKDISQHGWDPHRPTCL